MNQKTKDKLELFVSHNNWSTSHSLDKERFWEFVIEAHNNDDNITKEDFCSIIRPLYQLNEQEADNWFSKYENGRELLNVYIKL